MLALVLNYSNIFMLVDLSVLKKEAEKLGQTLGRLPKKILEEGAVVVAISGELGAGKTTFSQFLAESLGLKEKVISPTYIIFRQYDLAGGSFKSLMHIDAYRLEKEAEAGAIELPKILAEKRSLVLIEWPEKIASLLPKNYYLVSLKHSETPNFRDLSISFSSRTVLDIKDRP